MREVIHKEPFPHLIIEDFYDEDELELIWEELNFYTKPGKLLNTKGYGGIAGKTNARALELESVYRDLRSKDGPDLRHLSNILTVNRKIHISGVLDTYSNIEDCCRLGNKSIDESTKIRYYHNGEYYKPHTDAQYQTLVFSYFYKEPKKFEGGELYFPNYDYEFSCLNKSIIIFPAWVEHGVKMIQIDDNNYYGGYGRYAITTFLWIDTPFNTIPFSKL